VKVAVVVVDDAGDGGGAIVGQRLSGGCTVSSWLLSSSLLGVGSSLSLDSAGWG